MLEHHQFDAASEPFTDLRMERFTADLELDPRRCADVRWQWLAGTFAEPDRAIQKKLGNPARAEPRESAGIRQPPEGEPAIASQTVPAKMS